MPDSLPSLHLNVKDIYFQEAKDGTKLYEYRAINEYWTKRLEGRTYADIQYKSGYPAKDDKSKIITFPWRGKKTIKGLVHPHFNNVPTDVYAIRLEL